MGWSVHVQPVTHFAAYCLESLPVWPLVPGHQEGPTPERCSWEGPLRATNYQAEDDAAQHRMDHADGWDLYQRTIDWLNDPQGRETPPTHEDGHCPSCGARHAGLRVRGCADPFHIGPVL